MNSVSAVVAAGGLGLRMRDKTRKQYLVIGGRPVLSHALLAIDACPMIQSIYLAVPEEDVDFCHSRIVAPLALRAALHFVPGGRIRQGSVYNALIAMNNAPQVVVIHDGVRPFVTPDQITACIETAMSYGAASLGIPAFETLKSVDEEQNVVETISRKAVWLTQTPQAFSYELIRSAHDAARACGVEGTDDAFLVERLGCKVRMVRGGTTNIKITTPDDITLAEAILAARGHHPDTGIRG